VSLSLPTVRQAIDEGATKFGIRFFQNPPLPPFSKVGDEACFPLTLPRQWGGKILLKEDKKESIILNT